MGRGMTRTWLSLSEADGGAAPVGAGLSRHEISTAPVRRDSVRPFATPRGPDDPEVPPVQLLRHLRPASKQGARQPGRRPVLSTVVVMAVPRGVVIIGIGDVADVHRRQRGAGHRDHQAMLTGGTRRRSCSRQNCRALTTGHWNRGGSLRVADRVRAGGSRQQEKCEEHSAGHSDRLRAPPCELLPHTTRMPHVGSMRAWTLGHHRWQQRPDGP